MKKPAVNRRITARQCNPWVGDDAAFNLYNLTRVLIACENRPQRPLLLASTAHPPHRSQFEFAVRRVEARQSAALAGHAIDLGQCMWGVAAIKAQRGNQMTLGLVVIEADIAAAFRIAAWC